MQRRMFGSIRSRDSSQGRGAGRNRRASCTLEDLEPRVVLSLLGQQLFPSDNPWNQSIANAPVAANSAAIISGITARYGDGLLHPDVGQNTQDDNPLYGIPYNVVHGDTQPHVSVVIDAYADESDIVPMPIPANAVLEGDRRNGPTEGVENRGDSHLIVYDVDNNIAYELYHASRPSENADGKWHADQQTVWDLKTNQYRPLGWTSADAAGLPILPGLVRPDEGLPQSQGGQGAIPHAIRFTLENSVVLNQFVYPASHVANPGNTNAEVQPPMGTRFRLKASVDLSGLAPQSRIIAQAMKDYGLILADNGSNFFFSGASDSVDASNNRTLTWDDDDIQDRTHGLKSLNFSDFEVVDLTPVVTGLSSSAGAVGSSVTVIGRNFAGASGRLQVFFGDNPSSSVTVVDDAHLLVQAPPGAGTVDVRVLSGLVTDHIASNINDPVFGYGMSRVTPGDRFTYSGLVTDIPPTIVSPAAASPGRVTGTWTALSVLGGDDGGEPSLDYTWTVIASPAGAQPVFQSNGGNAARNTTVIFDRAGGYVFRVTVTDQSGQHAASEVAVTVARTRTRVVVSPSSVTLSHRMRRQFTAAALDQLGLKMPAPPAFRWTIVRGGGRLSARGLYTAPARGQGRAIVQASAGRLYARATVYYHPTRPAFRR